MSEQRTISELGSIDGKLLFFGGVYSNLQALEALKKWADERAYTAERIFCTGDILGYCAAPQECLQLIQEWGIQCIVGNVELQIRDGEENCGCDFKEGGRCELFSKNWYAYTRANLNADAISWLHSLPHHIQFYYGGRKVTLVHGSWFHTAEFIFRSTPWSDKQRNFDATGSDLIVAGHCGLPFAHIEGSKGWLNPGVIGMPANDGTDRVWFLTMEPSKEGICHEFHHYRYNAAAASAAMRNAGLPVSYADTLLSGIWDNCEILPEWETGEQGVALSF